MVETNMTTHDRETEIKALLTKQKATAFREAYLDLHVYEQAQIFVDLDKTQRARLYRYLTPEEVGDMFNAIEEEPQDVVGYFKEMPLKYAGEVIYEMYTDNAVDILAYADPQDLNEYLRHVPQEAANEIREMLHYEDKTAGAIMSTEYVAITANQTVRSALQVVKKEALDAETIYYIYVIEDENKLQGVLTLRDLLTNDDDVLISDLMNTPVMSVRVDEDQAEVAQTIRDYNFLALPVTDFDDTLIGIINVDDIIDVIDEESAEDYSGFAGVDVENTPANPFRAAWSRLPWSLGLLILGLATAVVIEHYQALIQDDSTLIIFIAMIMGAAGNAGTQSLAVAARRLTNKEDESESFGKLILAEVWAGLLVGLASGLVFALIAGWWQHNYLLGLVLGLALMLSIATANLLGCLVPWGLDRIGIDSSVVPGALIATVSDVSSVILYFGLVQVFLRWMV
ncbi:magnesium transporter [Ligilactobacillus agilis]|uniref:magnesium transporter n=1 Tax=Ligilactobacillus agilis TaxID=1601 RepID=UPI00242DD9CF|nr:magnesium transporter [Ligilactobacillus agilis]